MRTDPPPTRRKKLPVTKRAVVTVKTNLPTVKVYRRKKEPSWSSLPMPKRKGYPRHNFEDVYEWRSPESYRAQANSKMMPKRRKAKKK